MPEPSFGVMRRSLLKNRIRGEKVTAMGQRNGFWVSAGLSGSNLLSLRLAVQKRRSKKFGLASLKRASDAK
jgi:hypothetical protein